MKHCANCDLLIAFGKKDGANSYCSQNCLEHHKHPGFCKDCIAETTDRSPGWSVMVNGIGTRLCGGSAKCPTCYSVLKRKWFCFLFIPIVPLDPFRVKAISASKYIGRAIAEAKIKDSKSRVRLAGGA